MANLRRCEVRRQVTSHGAPGQPYLKILQQRVRGERKSTKIEKPEFYPKHSVLSMSSPLVGSQRVLKGSRTAISWLIRPDCDPISSEPAGQGTVDEILWKIATTSRALVLHDNRTTTGGLSFKGKNPRGGGSHRAEVEGRAEQRKSPALGRAFLTWQDRLFFQAARGAF